MKQLIFLSLTFFSFLSMAQQQNGRTYETSRIIADLYLIPFEDVSTDNANVAELVKFLEQNRFHVTIEAYGMNAPFVRVELPLRAEKRFTWILENTRKFPVQKIKTNMTERGASSHEMRVIPVNLASRKEYFTVSMDRRLVDSLVETLDKRFEESIMAIGVDAPQNSGFILVDVESIPENIPSILKTIIGLKGIREIRELSSPWRVVDMAYLKDLLKRRQDFTFQDLVSSPKTCSDVF
jgi:hypothetical protein